MAGRRYVALAAIVALGFSISGCATTAPAAEPSAPAGGEVGADDAPPPPAFYIVGRWECRIENNGNGIDVYTFDVGDSVVHMSVLEEGSRSQPYAKSYDYTLVGNMMTTHPEEGAGWAIELPDEITYGGTNYFRVTGADGSGANYEAELTADTATLKPLGLNPYDCKRVPQP